MKKTENIFFIFVPDSMFYKRKNIEWDKVMEGK